MTGPWHAAPDVGHARPLGVARRVSRPTGLGPARAAGANPHGSAALPRRRSPPLGTPIDLNPYYLGAYGCAASSSLGTSLASPYSVDRRFRRMSPAVAASAASAESIPVPWAMHLVGPRGFSPFTRRGPRILELRGSWEACEEQYMQRGIPGADARLPRWGRVLDRPGGTRTWGAKASGLGSRRMRRGLDLLLPEEFTGFLGFQYHLPRVANLGFTALRKQGYAKSGSAR